PGVGPEHAWLKDTGRAQYVVVDDDEALAAFHDCCRIEGILPALESSHALAHAARIAPSMPKDRAILVNLSGRGDKDMHTVAQRGGLGRACPASLPPSRGCRRPGARRSSRTSPPATRAAISRCRSCTRSSRAEPTCSSWACRSPIQWPTGR